MKKCLFGAIALLSMHIAIGQEGSPKVSQVPDTAFKEMYTMIKRAPRKVLSSVEKLQVFNKAVDWLEKSRNCLSGIGCTKRQAYLANFVLGAALGLGKMLGKIGFTIVDWRVDLLDAIVTELGYRYFVKEKVSLFRCLTFRGCSDQTKRYLMFELGAGIGGPAGSILMSIVMPKKFEAWQAKRVPYQQEITPQISVSNVVKETLNLDPARSTFEWYEVLGFEAVPSAQDAHGEYRKLALQYHPDKASEAKKELYTGIMQVLNDAKGQIPAEEERAESPGRSSLMEDID